MGTAQEVPKTKKYNVIRASAFRASVNFPALHLELRDAKVPCYQTEELIDGSIAARA
jgi:hypothetical protein